MRNSITTRVRALIPMVLVIATAVTFLAPRAANAMTVTSDEQAMLKLINQARTSRGIRALTDISGLITISRNHDIAMIKKGSLYHTSDSQLSYELRNYGWTVAGENVGRGTSVKAIFNAYWNSSTHRANILYSKFRYVGVGVTWHNGVAYDTLTFIDN